MGLDDYQGSMRVSLEILLPRLSRITGRPIAIDSHAVTGEVTFVFLRAVETDEIWFANVPRIDFARHPTERILANVLQNVKEQGFMLPDDTEPPARIPDPDLESRFTYHPPKPGQPGIYEGVRAAFKELAYTLIENCPASLDREEALKHLQNSMYWANAAIARHGT